MPNQNKIIYLDYSATTPVDPGVANIIDEHLRNSYGNASSIHAVGRISKVILEESREIIAKSIGAETSEIFFTSGGTESDNQALIGTAFAERESTSRNHIILSAIEHHAVLDCAEYLKELGFKITHLPVDTRGMVKMEDIERAITTETFLISVMHANNETGMIQPIRQISDIVKQHNIIIHSDVVQTYGKILVNADELMVDLLSLSAHKIYGPKGIGAIYIRKGTKIDALIHGGAQERKNRAGTENVPLIAGFAKAVELSNIHRESMFQNAVIFKQRVIDGITSKFKGILVNGDVPSSLPHILNVSLDSKFYDIEGESLLLNLDLNNVAVSSGSACTSGSIQPSHVLLAMGRDERTTKATVRFSFGRMTTMDEIESTIRIFCTIVEKFKR